MTMDTASMRKDVFVSYSTPDKRFADEICTALESAGIACWIAPRDVPPGAKFDEAILDAIEASSAMVLLLSQNANQSPFVSTEVNRAFANGKTIFTFRIEDVLPARALELYLARSHWTDGFPPPLDESVRRVSRAILALLGRHDARFPLHSKREPAIDANAAVVAHDASRSATEVQAPRTIHRYVSVDKAYLLPKPERVMVFHGIAIQTLGWGERVQLIDEDSNYVHVRVYSGKQGYLWPQWLQESDPKSYFEGDIFGEHRIGFLNGPAGDDEPGRLLLKQSTGDYYVPIWQVQRLEISPTSIRVSDVEGAVTDVDDVEGRFVMGPMPSIKSGIGRELSLGRKNFSDSLMLIRIL